MTLVQLVSLRNASLARLRGRRGYPSSPVPRPRRRLHERHHRHQHHWPLPRSWAVDHSIWTALHRLGFTHARACARGPLRPSDAFPRPSDPPTADGRPPTLVPVDAALRVTTVPLEHQSDRRKAIAGRVETIPICASGTGYHSELSPVPSSSSSASQRPPDLPSDALEQPLQLSCRTVCPLQFRIVPSPATSTRVGLGRACSRPPLAAVDGSPHMSWLPRGYTSEFPRRVFAATGNSLCRLPARFFLRDHR